MAVKSMNDIAGNTLRPSAITAEMARQLRVATDKYTAATRSESFNPEYNYRAHLEAAQIAAQALGKADAAIRKLGFGQMADMPSARPAAHQLASVAISASVAAANIALDAGKASGGEYSAEAALRVAYSAISKSGFSMRPMPEEESMMIRLGNATARLAKAIMDGSSHPAAALKRAI